MDFGSILLILSLAVLAALFVSQPLLNQRQGTAQQGVRQARAEDHQRSALLAERDRLLLSLRDLDFDNTMGKIPEEDYPAQRTLLLSAGAEVQRKLEEMGYVEERAGKGSPASAQRRRAVMTDPDDELEEMIAAYRKERQEKLAGFCPNCGKPVRKSDHFCARCGTSI